METPKFYLLKKVRILILDDSTKSWNHLSFVNISPTLVIDTSMEWSSRVPTSPWKTKNVNIFQKVWNRQNWILSVPRVSIRREKKSPWLCQYQSYISNWYVNGKVFEYYNMETKNLIFLSEKFEIEFDLCWRAEINIQVGLTYMSTSGMHRSPFWGLTSSLFMDYGPILMKFAQHV